MKYNLLFGCLLTGTAFSQQIPTSMTRVETVLQSPDVPAGSFASKPKVMYRAGTRFCRIEEAPDPDKAIHGLLIINEPDFWMVNLLTKTARHGVDPGPTFNCRMLVFPETAGSDLELGMALQYFKSKGATPAEGPVLQTKKTTAYRIDVGDVSLALFTYGTPERPLAVARIKGEKHEIFWYSGYGEVAFESKLFTLPEGIKVDDSKR